MGPVSRYLGPLVPAEPQLWQDPVPAVDHELIGDEDIAALKSKILASGLSVSELVAHRVGVGRDVPRHRQARRGQRGADSPAPQKDWEVNAATGERARDARADPAGVQRLAARRQEGLARRPDRARRMRRGRAGGEGRRTRRDRSVRAGAHGRLAGADRRRVVRRARAEGRRVPQLPRRPARSCPPSICWSSGPTC